MALDRVIVIGASAGGVHALIEVVRGLPPDLPAAVFTVLHLGSGRSALPEILSRAGSLPASHPSQAETIRPGRVYAAPPDRHLAIHDSTVQVLHGPRENGHRPAIDVLFRSAARSYGRRVIGVVLTGNLDDGTAGLLAIRMREGGLAGAENRYRERARAAERHADVLRKILEKGEEAVGMSKLETDEAG